MIEQWSSSAEQPKPVKLGVQTNLARKSERLKTP
jgi:hypothetical protein